MKSRSGFVVGASYLRLTHRTPARRRNYSVFCKMSLGNPAIVGIRPVDRWFCAPPFGAVCPDRERLGCREIRLPSRIWLQNVDVRLRKMSPKGPLPLAELLKDEEPGPLVGEAARAWEQVAAHDQAALNAMIADLEDAP